MSAHTPGPWSESGDNELDPTIRYIRDSTGLEIAVVYPSGERHESDARLIAAAPELLEGGRLALKALREMHTAALHGRQVILDRGAFDALEAAIAAAEGK